MSIEEKLPQVKQVELEILCVIDEFCRKNNLKYSLAYGTLLGAVRHKGFIPWDDDIDIFMPREDYDKFIKLWSRNPVQGYILQNTDNSPDFTQNFTKIRKDNTTFLQSEEEKSVHYHTGVFVDIFPVDELANEKIKKYKQKLYAVLMMLYYRKFVPPNETGIKKYISKILLNITPKSKYEALRHRYESKFINSKSNKSNSLVCACTFRELGIIYLNNMFDNLQLIVFEGKEFYITSNYDEVLKTCYGNYMELPPEDERTWAHHPLLIDLSHNYDEL